MRRVAILLTFIAVALAISASSEAANRRQFQQFKLKYGKTYTGEENDARYRNFAANLQRNKHLNAINPKATFGVNKFSDLSEQEFAEQYLMTDVDFNHYVAPPAKDFTKVSTAKPLASCNPTATAFDWFTCGVCTPIYNQGQCGSCWAFSATETIESYHAIGGGALTQLSMQQIVDCDTAGEDQGCGGGFPSGAYQYIESAGGIEPLSDYPYTSEGGESGSCNFQSSDVAVQVTGYNSVTGETGLYQQLSSQSGGPVSICVDASSWQSYTGGVLSTCGTQVDHCVQLTGYANYGESGAYWIVRNSWGESWGEAGFIWIEIGQDLCQIGDYATIVSTN